MSETPTSPEEVQTSSQESAQEKPFEEAFDELFPWDKFDKSIRGTAQGSTEGLEDITQEVMSKLLSGRQPEIGVIKIQKLPDGGYEVRSYKSKE